MVLVLLPVLIGAAIVGVARGAQYGDYAAAKMPQYGSDDYPESARELAPSGVEYSDRSPEVPASPDYKYEEDFNFRTINVKSDEVWRKSTKKLPRAQRQDVKTHSQQSHQYNSNKAITKFKQTFRPRLKSRNSGRNFNINKNSFRSGRIKSNDVIDKEDDFINEDRYHDHFENDKVYVRATSERVVRRKPRDRSITAPEVEAEEIDDDDDDEGKNEQEDVKDAEYSMSEESAGTGERSGESEQLESTEEPVVVKRPTPSRSDDDILARLEAKKLDQKTEDNYQDYYDMKRVNNIKKKITVLYRRTKARATGTTTSRRVRVWTYRRSYVLDRYGTPKSDDVDTPLRGTTRMRTRDRNKTKTQTRTSINRPSTTIPPTTTVKTTRTIRTTTTTKTTTTKKAKGAFKSELSLAEKSRMSILKKAQLKESLMNKTVTLKPPVLLQVSQRMNTMVMVEPQKKGSNLQLMGSLGSVMSDTPERLARAKKIMRRKLVAGARNIHDLTDKWDEVICDYLDISQLDDARENRYNDDLTASSAKSAPVAERELRAVLSAHRQRKEVPIFATAQVVYPEPSIKSAPASQHSIPTFPPNVVDERMRNEWNEFVASNESMRLQFSMCIVFLVVINHLQRYNIHLIGCLAYHNRNQIVVLKQYFNYHNTQLYTTYV